MTHQQSKTITLLSGVFIILAQLMTTTAAYSSATAPFKLTYNLKVKKISDSIYWLEGINGYPDEGNGGNMVNTGNLNIFCQSFTYIFYLHFKRI